MSLVLVTRPLAEGQALAARLAALGHHPLLQPMLEFRPRDLPEVDLRPFAAVALSSAAAAPLLGALTPLRDVPVFAVGPATAAAARQAGFLSVTEAGGDVAALAETLARARPRRVLHAGGSVLAGDLTGALAAQGILAERLILYDAVPVPAFAPEVQAALAEGRVGQALFFSPRSAEHFASLAARAAVSAGCAGTVAVCLSAAVSRALDAVPFRARRVAERPIEAALLACLDPPASEPP